MTEHEQSELSTGERAELEALRDLRARVIGFGGDDYTVMPWIDAHRTHANDPYIGCPFCRPNFVAVHDLLAPEAVWRGVDALDRLDSGTTEAFNRGLDDARFDGVRAAIRAALADQEAE